MSIHLRYLSKRFGSFTALDDVSLDVPEGKLLALLGPSGSGKTTLLRIIAGLENPDRGEVLVNDEEVTHQSARDRNVGFVFQHYALFRHMTIFENIAFALRVRAWSNPAIRARVHELLELLRLAGLEQRYPAQLSGGQQQRVALARALAAQPKVLLLDEPFGALDARVRQELRRWLRRLHDDLGVTGIFVMHDQEEAFAVADRVVVMRAGRVEQTGSPQEVFERPANAFVMDFLGQVNVFHGRVQNGRAVLGSVEVACPEYAGHDAGPALVCVRPHELEIDRTADKACSLRAQVLHVNPAGSVTRVQLHAPEFNVEIHVEVSPARYAELCLKTGEMVYVSPRRFRIFVPDGPQCAWCCPSGSTKG